MGMTMTQKILAAHAGLDSVEAGQLILVNLDRVLGNDITSPVAIREFNKLNKDNVFDKDKVTMVMDHFAPNKDIKAATQCKMCRDFCGEKEITHFYDVGQMGIEHALLPEKGLVVSGDVVIGADSHTCTYGALVHSLPVSALPIWHAAWRSARLVQGTVCYQVCSQGQAEPVHLRQGRDPAHHWQDRRRRCSVPLYGIHWRGRGFSVYERPSDHDQHGNRSRCQERYLRG